MTSSPIIEYLATENARICGLPLDAALVIFRTDNSFDMSEFQKTLYCETTIIQLETGGTTLEVDLRDNLSGQLAADIILIDASVVQSLGWRQAIVSLADIQTNPKLLGAFLYSVLANKSKFVKFSNWYQGLSKELKNAERYAPRSIKAAHIHIAELETICQDRELSQAAIHPIVQACGTEHLVPSQSDLDETPITSAYLTKYLSLWELVGTSEPQAIISSNLVAALVMDFVKFEEYSKFLIQNPGLRLA